MLRLRNTTSRALVPRFGQTRGSSLDARSRCNDKMLREANINGAVSLTAATRRPVRLLQLPRIRETENTRCLPGPPERVGGEEGTRAYAEGTERAPDAEGT
jgi:hypothetical protein